MKKQLILTLFALLSVFSARAYDFEVDGIYYNLISGTDDKVEVTYKESTEADYSGSVVIPEMVTYDGKAYRVTAIGERAFNQCSGLTSVTIPEGVDTIAWAAFSGCGGLTSVTIPESVTFIGGSAFSGCTGLASIVWNAKHCADFSSYSTPFNNKTSLTTITFGDKVEHIPAYLCYGWSGLTSVTIPEGVDTIGSSAFYGCSGLTSVTIPNSVTSIGSSVFADCSGLTSVTIPNSVTYRRAGFFQL